MRSSDEPISKKLWYGSDEVRDFHPIIEKCLKDALKEARLAEKYEITHHFGNFTTGIPDFALLDKRTKDFVCIIEVKKTPSDVFGQDSGEQCKGYVEELYPLRWRSNLHPYFCVTNIEFTQFFCLRQKEPLIGCLLEGSPAESGTLNYQENCIKNFVSLFCDYFKKIDVAEPPKFSMHLEAISKSFNISFYSIAKILGVNLDKMKNLVKADDKLKQIILYELLRFAFYYYIKEKYILENSKFSNYFDDFEVDSMDGPALVSAIEGNFSKAMKIDFVDILKNYDSPDALIPTRLEGTPELAEVFVDFIRILGDNSKEGIKKNQNLMNFVSLLTSEIYNKDEMHASGKIMSDEILSNLLAEFAIVQDSDTVLDPCCGDGNLLISSYNCLKKLKSDRRKASSHNSLLEQLCGIEIDPNLLQLAAFKLICSDLKGVDKETKTNLKYSDLFDIFETDKYDAIVMNPPYLRNEDVKDEIKARYLANIEKNTGKNSFIKEVQQPNLYFYFVEKATSMLKPEGRASIILMSKFLTNRDGEYLKRFLMPYVNAIISYPPDFFKGFRVTTCIVLISKSKKPNEKVSFLKINDTNVLANTEAIKGLLKEGNDVIHENYSLVNISRTTLDPAKNWRLFLVDPTNKFETFERLTFMASMSKFFKIIKRGVAGNSGGSSVIFPFSSNNPLSIETKAIEKQFIGYGLLVNKVSNGRRKFILTNDCLTYSPGLMLPAPYESKKNSGLPSSYLQFNGLRDYSSKAENTKIKGSVLKWSRIVDEDYSSQVIPDIIIPRGDREKHSVYYNPLKSKKILISTNFFYLSDFVNFNQKIDKELQQKFITAFLLSSFGQIQFEIHSNNQEGSRKIEGFMIGEFKVPNLDGISPSEMKKVVAEFDALDKKDEDVNGLESENPRNGLDNAFAELIYARNNLGFENSQSMVAYFQEFLRELVKDRKNE